LNVVARSIGSVAKAESSFSQNNFAKKDTQELRKELQNVKKLARERAKAITLRIPQLKDCKNHFDKKKEKGKGKMVFICEGQSAAGSITSCRDVNNQAVFVLKGKPLNVWDLKREVMYMTGAVLAIGISPFFGRVGCMARKLRVEYPGAIYHVMSSDRRREQVVETGGKRSSRTMRIVNSSSAPWGEACGKTGWQVHALCLMPNHFHMVVETPRGNLVAGMKWWLGTYTGRFNSD